MDNYDDFPVSDYKTLAMLKISSLMNVKEISAAEYIQFRNRLNKDDATAIDAVKEIDVLERKLVNPFCDAYVKDFVKNFNENSQYRNRLTSRKARYYRIINERLNEHFNTILIKNNADFTQEYVKSINNLGKTSIVIANTSNIDVNILNALEESKFHFIHRGEHFMDLPRLEHFFLASELAKTIKEMQKIENDVNPEWSDTAKALYIARQIAQNCSYAEDKKFEKNLFIEKKGNCEAISCCYEEMMKRQNIPCRVCETDDGGHVFNEICVNNKWVPVDVTWLVSCQDEKELAVWEPIEFAGEKFRSGHAEEDRYNHESDRAYSMRKDKTFNFLTSEELNAARREISENPKNKSLSKFQQRESVTEI